jgi:hypothetical protein
LRELVKMRAIAFPITATLKNTQRSNKNLFFYPRSQAETGNARFGGSAPPILKKAKG